MLLPGLAFNSIVNDSSLLKAHVPTSKICLLLLLNLLQIDFCDNLRQSDVKSKRHTTLQRFRVKYGYLGRMSISDAALLGLVPLFLSHGHQSYYLKFKSTETWIQAQRTAQKAPLYYESNIKG